ncbi:MAG: hypothetical protein AABZ10_00805 [Nitrospirota bacterium]
MISKFTSDSTLREEQTVGIAHLVRLLHPLIEGRLAGGFEGMDVGHRLRVQLISTDVERGYIDFKRVG